ncbi:craniofacial development protein 2-like [Antedon mediterranea]|uniref:craniofacial development protein 2-like n=1 Tax=Antedon mediterranea TaxID=105859 RepID=UPI003AF6B284
MCPGFSNDPRTTNDSRKTAIINRELKRLNIDIAALQETRLPSNGSIRERDYTFFWQELEPDQPQLHGVGFAVSNSLVASVEPPSKGTARILSLRLSTSSGTVNILSIYAPTLCSTPVSKDEFYEELDSAIRGISATEHLYLLGDFNARVGSDHHSWSRSIGHFGVGKLNENGQRLLELCSYHDLCITNTFFSTKPQHKVSWRHPRSHHWHQLDLVITRRSYLNDVNITRSYHSGDCDTDHSMVRSTVCLQPKQIHRSRHIGRPRINTVKTNLQDLCARFAQTIDEMMKDCPTANSETRWAHIRDAIYTSVKDIFGVKDRKTPDWFESGISAMEPALEAKRAALIDYKRDLSERTLEALRKSRNNAQRIARQCSNWLNLCQDIQLSADHGNTGAMYAEELENPPTLVELSKAIDVLACGKAPGKDGIPPEVLKAGSSTLLQKIHELLLQCWEEGSVPQDMRDANIVTLYTNKGDRSDCINYRGISLLSIVGKVFARVVLTRLQSLAERVYHEAQCGFRAGRLTIEKCREQSPCTWPS